MTDRQYAMASMYLIEYILNSMAGDEFIKVEIKLGATGRKIFEKNTYTQTRLSDYFSVNAEEKDPMIEKYVYYTVHKRQLKGDNIEKLLAVLIEDFSKMIFSLR